MLLKNNHIAPITPLLALTGLDLLPALPGARKTSLKKYHGFILHSRDINSICVLVNSRLCGSTPTKAGLTKAKGKAWFSIPISLSRVAILRNEVFLVFIIVSLGFHAIIDDLILYPQFNTFWFLFAILFHKDYLIKEKIEKGDF